MYFYRYYVQFYDETKKNGSTAEAKGITFGCTYDELVNRTRQLIIPLSEKTLYGFLKSVQGLLFLPPVSDRGFPAERL